MSKPELKNNVLQENDGGGFTWRETFGGQADLEDVRRHRRQAERKKLVPVIYQRHLKTNYSAKCETEKKFKQLMLASPIGQ